MIPLIKTLMPPRELLMPELEKVLYSGYIAQGAVVDEFEEAFRKFFRNEHVLSLNSGTAALHIALNLAGVKPGDEVISTPITAEPTNVAIKMAGAKVVWGDVDYQTGTLSPASVEKKITGKTRAILAVDYAGVPIDIKGFRALESKYGIPVIEDAAHALGAKYDGQYLGNHFNYVVYSFQAIKHLTTVDGGMLSLKNKEDFEKGKLMRWFGLDKSKSRMDNLIQVQGYKYHMNNVNAAIGLVQLRQFKAVLETYYNNGKYFDLHLQNIPGIELLTYYPGSEPSYWLYTLKVEKKQAFIDYLNEKGINATDLHKRNDLHPYLNDNPASLPVTDEFYGKMVHLPCGWWVGQEEREYIVETIKKGW